MAIDKLTTSSLEDNSVTSPKLAPGAVTEDDIGDSSLPLSKLSEVDLNIAPEVLEIQVSAPAAGQDTQWLWTWLTSSLPYARRTITNSPELQVPLYKQGTYTVNNFAAYDIFDQMTQTHSLYLKWIDGAGTDNLVSWATSTGPVSDSHPDINGGSATDVQRINVNVPATITLPTLTPPNVSYTVTNNGAGAYTFSGAAKGDNPNLGPFYRGGTYTIDITATGHPFYFTTDNGTNFASGTYFGEYTDGVTGSRTDSGTITFTVPNDAPDTLYYQCGNHGVMRGAITVKNLAVETNINGNYVVYFQHTQEGHKTPVELRPIPSLVNQMCLVYDADSGKFVPQDLATYVENTPSFENKIREVAGTAELVVEDGSAVIAKVNVYDDSTYLPLVGNNPGDQAFATDTDILYIWDGSAWQQAGASNSDDLTEGTTNLFYTDARVSTYLSSNGYDTATNIVATITDSAPTTLDTLNELAAALGDDPNFATTVTNNIATKLSSADFNSTADTWLGTKDTDDLSEGSSNLYHTTARVQGTSITAGSLRGSVNNATVQYGTSYSGTPIQGSFFFDSLNQKLKVYTGSAFVDAVPAGTGGGGGGGETAANATFRKYTYSITSTTNAVSGADDNAETLSYVTDGTQNVEVFINGSKVVEGASNDYVASTGTSVTFTSNVDSGDVVEVQVYELLTNDAYYLKTETYTQTETNTQISTALAGLVDSAPTTLDTLNELAAALGDDPNFATTVTNSIAGKLSLTGGTLTGNLTIGPKSNAQLKIIGDSTGYCEGSVLLQNAYTSNPAARGNGTYYYSLGNQIEWFSGRPYSSNDQFIISRKTGITDGNQGKSTAETTNKLLTIDSNGNLSIYGNSIKLPTGTSNPSSPVVGDTYFNSTDNQLRIYNGSEWGAVVFSALGTQANPAETASDILDNNPLATSGLYWIKSPGMVNAMQVYCDMTYDGGGWMLIAYGHVATASSGSSNYAIPNLNHDGNTWGYNPNARSGTNGVLGNSGALNVAKASTQFLMAFGNTVNSGGIDQHSYVYKFNIPDPSALTFANHTVFYNSGQGISTVTVTGLKGQTGTWTRYTLTESLGCTWSDSYPTRYGCTTASNPRSANTNDGPAFSSIHSGSGHSGGGNGTVSSPDVGTNGYGTGSLNYQYQGIRSATSSNYIGSKSIWVK